MKQKEAMFVDRAMYDVAIAFDEYNRNIRFHTTRSKRENSKRFAETLSKFFGNVGLKDVSSFFVLDVLTSPHITDKESRDIIRFVVFLLQEEYVKDNILFRLTIFDGNMSNTGNKSDIISSLTISKIIKILTSKNFHEYIDSGTLVATSGSEENSREIGKQLFLIELPNESCFDSEMYEFLSNHFEGIKLNTTLNVHTRKAQALAFVDVAKIFFQNITNKDITREYLYNTLKDNEKILTSPKGKRTVSELHKAVLSMISRGLIKDEQLSHLATLGERLLFGVPVIETFLNVLGNPAIDKFVQIPYPDGSTKFSLYHVNIQSNEIRDAFIEFALNYSNRGFGFVRFCEEFDTSLGDYHVERIKDLNFNTYKSHLLHFNKYANDENRSKSKSTFILAPITSFYLYIKQTYNGNIFDKSGVDSNILERLKIGQEILDGYIPIPYNPHEEIPDVDKWLLCYGGMETNNSSELISVTSSILLDFTQIKSETYRKFCKHYVWYYDSGIDGKNKNLKIIIKFCNYISDLKSGAVRYLGVTPTKDERITMNEIIAFKYYVIDSHENNTTIATYISPVRVFLNFISENDFMNFENGVFWHLKDIPSYNKSNANAIVDEDLDKVSALMKKKTEESVFNHVCFYVLYLAIHTPFRSSHIITWKLDAITDTIKEGQFRTYSRTKTSHGRKQPIPVTERIKRAIDNAIRITEPYRQECKNKKIKNYVFIVEGLKKGTYRGLSTRRFNAYFRKCCEEVGINPEYTLANLRDTRMSKAEVEVAKKGYSDLEQRALTHHNDANSINSYSDIDIRECLEAVYQIYIGNVDIKGKVVKKIPKDIATEERSVSEGCGYCGTKSCDNYSFLGCLMCKHFQTSPEQIPFFQEQINICDKKIAEAKINHDKEDFQAIKRLMVAFLERLILIKEEDNNEQHIS